MTKQLQRVQDDLEEARSTAESLADDLEFSLDALVGHDHDLGDSDGPLGKAKTSIRNAELLLQDAIKELDQ